MKIAILLLVLAAPAAAAQTADDLVGPVVRGPLAERIDAHLRDAAEDGFPAPSSSPTATPSSSTRATASPTVRTAPP